MRAHLTLALLALTTGCKAVDADPVLFRFQDCDELDDFMSSVAKTEAKYEWSWSAEMGFGSYDYEVQTMEDGGGEAAPNDAASSYSTTNTQENDVDEDDLVKTDGTYLYSLSGAHLAISQAWPVDEAVQLSATEIDGEPSGIYLVDDKVIAISEVWNWGGSESIAPRSGADWDRDDYALTLVTVIDVSDPGAPVVERETYTSGELKTTRRIGDTLYVVTYQDVDVVGDAEDYSEAKSRIKDASPSDWLPGRLDNVLNGSTWATTSGDACDCADVWASDAESGTYTTNVLSLDLADPLSDFRGEGVVGRADTVYASSNAVYVAFAEWTDGAFPTTDERVDSIIHKFDISGAEAVPGYDGTAKFSGSIDDQFSMSEYQGVLRVAATELVDDTTSSVIYTLEEQGGQFAELDSYDGIAPNESIFAARFVGDLGYLVTYEQIDPLFTFDLSNPSDIRLAGELEVTGWSDYIHPMDEDHLLTIGTEDDWSLSISIFDVSDLENPTLQDRLTLDASSSEASYDHHAFNYFAAEQVLAVPSWTDDGDSVLEVIHATPDEPLSSYGRVDQSELIAASGEESWCGSVRRSVVMEEYVYSVSGLGLVAAEITDPSHVLSTVAFEGTDPCDGYYDY